MRKIFKSVIRHRALSLLILPADEVGKQIPSALAISGYACSRER